MTIVLSIKWPENLGGALCPTRVSSWGDSPVSTRAVKFNTECHNSMYNLGLIWHGGISFQKVLGISLWRFWTGHALVCLICIWNNVGWVLVKQTRSAMQNLDPYPYIQWGLLTTFIKSHFLRSSKRDPQRCIETFNSMTFVLLCFVGSRIFGLVLWSCTAQAATTASQHHSCFYIHTTELDWQTFRPIQYLDLSSLNMVCKVSLSVTLTF